MLSTQISLLQQIIIIKKLLIKLVRTNIKIITQIINNILKIIIQNLEQQDFNKEYKTKYSFTHIRLYSIQKHFTNKNYVKISYNIYDKHPSGRAYIINEQLLL